MKLRTALLSFLFFLPLLRHSLLYSLKNCTIDFYDSSRVVCDFMKITSIPSDVPKNVTEFSIFYNEIQQIRRSDLTGLTKLQTLHLGNNRISHIEDEAFSDLSAAVTLVLNFNELKVLTDNMFQGLHNLTTLPVACNQIESVSQFAFAPLKKLQELDLSYNKITHIENIKGVLHCPWLKILDLTSNMIPSFESDLLPFPLRVTSLYLNMDSLIKFSLHSDVLPNLKTLYLFGLGSAIDWDISAKTFLTSVTTLSLGGSKLKFETYKLVLQSLLAIENLHLYDIGRFFEQGLLDVACSIPSIKVIDLRLNGISVLNDSVFWSCATLTDVDLSQNSMTGMTPASLRTLTRLARLTLRENELSRIPLSIRNMTSLTYLSLESNVITELSCSDFMNVSSLTELNLKSNKISSLKRCVFAHLPNLIVFDVENNYINVLKDSFGASAPNLASLNINGNSLGWIQSGAFRNMSSLEELSAISVRETSIQNGAFKGLLNLKRLFISPPLFSGEFFADLKKLESLEIFLTIKNAGFVQNRKPLFVHLPALQDLTIKASRVGCIDWAQYVLNHLDNLHELSLDAICCDDKGTFHSTPHLRKLQITNCVGFTLELEFFHPLLDLKILDLSKNVQDSLGFLVEANLTSLEMLIFKTNRLRVINESVFASLPSLKYLDLSGNPFVCNCSNAGFIEWVITNKQVQVVSAYQYTCSSPSSEEGHFLLDFNVQSCWEFTGFLCFICSSALVLLTLLSSFIFHFLRWQLVYGYYLLLAFLYDSKKRRQGCPHIYDAFVSYNVHDEDWVYGELLPELEGRQGWRLCLHHRDFLPGKPIIENITDAIYSSRKTLCVISRRYLQSEWCSREIQLASFRLFDEQKDVLVLLFLEEISSNQLSPFYRMRKLVKRRTYLSWTQAQSHKGLFWEKVRRALGSGNEPGDNHNPLTADV